MISPTSNSSAPHRSYFTCTLGEAQLLNQELPDAPYQTINAFIDYLAAEFGDDIAVGCARPAGQKDSLWIVEALTFKEIKTVSTILAHHLLEKFDNDSVPGTIALFASSSLVYLVYFLAWLRAGYKVALISTACSNDAVKHLLTAYNAAAVCCDDKHERATQEAIQIIQSENPSTITTVKIAFSSVADIWKLETPSRRQFAPQPSVSGQSSEIVLYGHSSGTSTGRPKPIPITHQDEIGALPRFHQVTELRRPKSTISTTPIYTGGLADLWRSWSAATALWTYPEDQAPITADNIAKYIHASKAWTDEHHRIASGIGYLSCVPFVTQMLIEQSDLLKWLQSLEMVGVGGAAMPAALGDMLVEKGINLVSRFGSRECGFLLSSDRDYETDKAWNYLRHNLMVDSIQFKRWNETDFELTVAKTWPSLSPAIRDQLPYNSHDVFVSHESIPNAWKYNGRSDVQITLTTGKKFDPAGIEGALTASEWIKDAVIVGNDRLLPAAVIFKSEQAEELLDLDSQERIESVVAKVNSTCPFHARLKTNMIAILASSEAVQVQKSSKGTIMRGKFAESFEATISGLYAEEQNDADRVSLIDLSEAACLDEIQAIVSQHSTITSLNIDSSFFDVGIDSTSSMQIRNAIKARLPENLSSFLPLNIVYDTGSIRSLSGYIRKLASITGGNQGNLISTASRKAEIDRLLARVRQNAVDQHISDHDLATPSTAEDASSAYVVLLTGATGFLGAHILVELTENPDIAEIVCLVRRSTERQSPNDVQQRFDIVSEKYGLGINNDQKSKITWIFANFHEPGLGLTKETNTKLSTRLTHIIHAAWAVNFSLPLQAYESQLLGITNLYALSTAATRPVHFVFISSTAAVLSGPQPILERLSDDPEEAANSGYGLSKWAAEKLLSELVKQQNSPIVSILRVGQLTANSVTGAWNPKEAWPLMFDAGYRLLGLHDAIILPDLSNVTGKELDWLPVDLAAKGVVELTFPTRLVRIGSQLKVFHVLSNEAEAPTWADVKEWLDGSIILDINHKKVSISTKFVSAQQWLEMLEVSGEENGKHLALSLISLWRQGWEEVPAKRSLEFSTTSTQKLSPTMKAVATGNIKVDDRVVSKFLSWLFSSRSDLR